MSRILVASPVVPYPSHSGNSVRIAQIIRVMNVIGMDVHFVLCPISAISDRRVDGTMENIFGPKYSELNNGHVSRGRWRQVLLDFAKKKLKLKKIDKVLDFIFADDFITASAHKEFKNLVEKIKPNVVICEYALLSKLVEDLDPNIVSIVDTHDRFAERNLRIRNSSGQGFWWSLTIEQERKLLSRFDHVLAIQENEARMFAKDLQEESSKLATLDIIAPSQRTIYKQTSQTIIGFIGSQNKHNEQGLQMFLQYHWSTIKKIVPEALFYVAGATYTEIQSVNYPDVVFLGRVKDLSSFYDQSTIIINPCLTGTGLKIKSVEALSHGKPLVATLEGAEGLSFILGKGLFVHELNSADFAMSCINLLNDEAMRKEHGQRAIEAINKRYEISVETLKTLIGKIDSE